jgi:hypothetical protein
MARRNRGGDKTAARVILQKFESHSIDALLLTASRTSAAELCSTARDLPESLQ